MGSSRIILSLLPGIGLLDKAFEECGYCVVRGPDILWGGDIRLFTPPPGIFWGIIGGPPCQDFSSLRRDPPTGYGLEMMNEFARCVTLANPEWWLLENVSRAPNLWDVTPRIAAGYVTQRIDIDNAWFPMSTSRRLRHIQFGSKSGRLLHVTRRSVTIPDGAALASDNRSFREVCRLQGLPDDFDLPPFLATEKIRAVGNGVPLPMGRAIARAVTVAYSGVTHQAKRRCACGCGRWVTGKKTYYDYACRKRAQRKRDQTRGNHSG